MLAYASLYNSLREDSRSDVGKFLVEVNTQQNAMNTNQFIEENPFYFQIDEPSKILYNLLVLTFFLFLNIDGSSELRNNEFISRYGNVFCSI